MESFASIGPSLVRRFRQHVLKDPFLMEAARWVKDKGDETLRLDYPLDTNSVVFDVGGFNGDFAAVIFEKYGCQVYVFEPVPEFYERCVARFKGNDRVVIFNYGLAAKDHWLDISLAENASSFTVSHKNVQTQKARVRAITECIRELRVNRIDLLKINIEGGEFELLPALIDSNDIKLVEHLQVQFHNFVDSAMEQRDAIRSKLALTHAVTWNYEFIWESWALKDSRL
jgi:FkbM family methyltransferase